MSKLLCGKSLDQIAIERLQMFEPAALAKSPDGYYVAVSGGKDSDVAWDLVRRSGVRHTAHYHVTTCDPPELVRHVANQRDIFFEKPEMTMWQLIRKKKLAPTRNRRFCCEILKERGGIDRLVVTGVRWEESSKRAKRKMFETCYRQKNKQFLNVIIEWRTSDVWEYIRTHDLKVCELYAEGWKRLGCVLCPMKRDIEREMTRWPRITDMWRRAIIESYRQRDFSRFDSAEAYWRWWLARDKQIPDDKQLHFFSD